MKKKVAKSFGKGKGEHGLMTVFAFLGNLDNFDWPKYQLVSKLWYRKYVPTFYHNDGAQFPAGQNYYWHLRVSVSFTNKRKEDFVLYRPLGAENYFMENLEETVLANLLDPIALSMWRYLLDKQPVVKPGDAPGYEKFLKSNGCGHVETAFGEHYRFPGKAIFLSMNNARLDFFKY